MDWSGAIERFIAIEGRAYADLDELSARLQTAGFSEDESERLIAFVPTAFARVLLEQSGATFTDGYEIRDLDSERSVRGRLSEEPAYVSAREFALSRRSDPAVAAIAGGSAEADAARKLRGNDSLASIVFSEPLFVRIPIEPKRRMWRRLGRRSV